MFTDPDFVRASEWLARGSDAPGLVVLGAPYSGASISHAACHHAPREIRSALARFSVYSSDEGASAGGLAAVDAGDIEFPSDDVGEAVEAITAAVSEVASVPVVLLGGDNSITAGGVRGTRATSLITFDAHHDCRDPANGRTNGSVVRELVDGGHVRAVTQIGIHGFANSAANAVWARDAGISVIGPRTVRARGIDVIVGEAMSRHEAARIWVDFDIDVLDRAFAPGAPAAMPGGLWPADLERAAFLLGRHTDVVGMDITEVDPTKDVAETTVRAACAVMMAFCTGVASR